MKDLMGMMKQVQDMQARMQRMQEELGTLEVTGSSGGGLVSVTLSGKGDMKRVRIDPSLLKPEEAEIIEDLIVAASSDAKSKVEAQLQEKMSEVTGGLPLPPGMKLFDGAAIPVAAPTKFISLQSAANACEPLKSAGYLAYLRALAHRAVHTSCSFDRDRVRSQ